MNRLQQLRRDAGMNMKEAAQALGMPYTTYVNYEKGTREPSSEVLIKIATYYRTSIDFIVGKTDIRDKETSSIPSGFEPLPQMVSVPLVGTIACGTPILAEENIEAHIGIPAAWRADFALTCKGDSMQPKIQDGDIVCIRKQAEVENGEIAAVRIDDEATLKRFYRQGDTVLLQAENPAYPPLVYTQHQLDDISIEGLAVGFCRGI